MHSRFLLPLCRNLGSFLRFSTCGRGAFTGALPSPFPSSPPSARSSHPTTPVTYTPTHPPRSPSCSRGHAPRSDIREVALPRRRRPLRRIGSGCRNNEATKKERKYKRKNSKRMLLIHLQSPTCSPREWACSP